MAESLPTTETLTHRRVGRGRHSKVKNPARNRTPAKKKSKPSQESRSLKELLTTLKASSLKDNLRIAANRLDKAFKTAKEFSDLTELKQAEFKPETLIQYFSEATRNLGKTVKELQHLKNTVLGTTRLEDVELQKARAGIRKELIGEIDSHIASINKIMKQNLPSSFITILDRLNRSCLTASAMQKDLRQLRMSPFEKARTQFTSTQEQAEKLHKELVALRNLATGDRSPANFAMHN